MAEYDNTKIIGRFLDRHLAVTLFEHLEAKKIYSDEEILKGKLALLFDTNMVDFAMDIYKKLYQTEEVPEEMKAKRASVISKLKSLPFQSEPLMEKLKDTSFIERLRKEGNFNMNHLKANYGVKDEHLDDLFRIAKFQFECGNYSATAEYLSFFRELSNDPEKNLAALWGKLAAEILIMENMEQATTDLEELKETIENKSISTPLGQLQQRAWVIHWSLFVYFGDPTGRGRFVDLIFSERYMNTVQTTCPHILRYLTAAVVTNKKRKTYLKNLVDVIEQESSYKDPITEFIEALYIKFDFETAQQKLKECERVLENDYFLNVIQEEFIENARLFIFETYCKIHSCIDINMLAQRLDMNGSEAERWIVNLIRNAKLDAKIDSAAGTVLMGSTQPSVFQQLIDKTKALSLKVIYIEREHARSKTRSAVAEKRDITEDGSAV
eukprot:TRINITY_DN2710_c0_g1_i2.p1 TRINITY_DN2710_c0_g1~~TRINITY_DN2710_c0_g1_i2.p1  ORF type:complete len:458 (-),score=97.97 TRINITY_DN2710_c0_g1_i2:87-1403(-)